MLGRARRSGTTKVGLIPFSPSSFTDRQVPPTRVVRGFRTPEFALRADFSFRQRTRDHDGSCRNRIFTRKLSCVWAVQYNVQCQILLSNLRISSWLDGFSRFGDYCDATFRAAQSPSPLVTGLAEARMFCKFLIRLRMYLGMYSKICRQDQIRYRKMQSLRPWFLVMVPCGRSI